METTIKEASKAGYPKKPLFIPDQAMNNARYHVKLSDILEAAATLFAKQGYHNTSIRDLAKALNTSLAGLYYYFKTKEDLLFLISQYSFNSVIGSLHEKLSPVDEPALKLHILVQNHLLFFVSHLDAMKVLAHETDSLNGDYFDAINEKKKTYLKILENILLEIQREKMKNPGLRVNPEIKLAALSLFGMMNWVYTWYNPKKREHSPTNIARISRQMVAIFLNGFLNENMKS